jgi:hypothetical protein
MNIIKQCSKIFLIAFALLAPLPANAQTGNEVFTLTEQSLQNDRSIELNKSGWKYRAGDEENWANLQHDDSSWEVLSDSTLKLDNLPQSGWNGIGWFRLRVSVDESAADKQLAFALYHWGASEIYVDGELVQKYGSVSTSVESERAFNPNGTPMYFSFNGAGAHTSGEWVAPADASPIRWPPYSPELDPVEDAWPYLRAHHWPDREYEGHEGLRREAVRRLCAVCDDAERLQGICGADYVRRRA